MGRKTDLRLGSTVLWIELNVEADCRQLGSVGLRMAATKEY
jgi:hypothetical protein